MLNLIDIDKGAQNLLINCAQLKAGDNLLIISEKQSYGWYKDNATESVSKVAKKLKINFKILQVEGPEASSSSELETIMQGYDCTIFFARLGDQNRFETSKILGKRVMCYARSAQDLASSFGTVHHQAMIDMKDSLNDLFLNSQHVELSCPQGTKLSGKMLNRNFYINSDVSVLRFPMVVPMPILGSSFSGKVLISNYLTSTSSQTYTPNSVKIFSPLTITIGNGKINGVDGSDTDVINFNNHYKFVSKKFGLNKCCVHSWHAGIHPGTRYLKSVEDDPDQWSNTIFGSPNYLHFHTCGELPPGEICWMVKDPTIKIDGNPLWEQGALNVEDFELTRNCLKAWPVLSSLYQRGKHAS
jgi:hypothetical protein